MRAVLADIRRWRERGERVALATVVGVRRSAPRPPGTKMAVSERGEIAGSVSGGCVEGAVVEAALEVLRGGPPRLMHFGIEDDAAIAVGLPCGGELDVWVEPHVPGRFDEIAEQQGRAVRVLAVEGPAAGAALVLEPDGQVAGSLGSPEFDRAAREIGEELLWGERPERRGELFFDVLGPAPRLVLVGAVDVASALCRLARATGWAPYVIDPRAAFATPERFPEAEEIITAWPEEAFARLGGIDPAMSIAVLTHDPKIDDAALQVALRSPARFVGAMGSRTATAARRERLTEAGLTDEELDRLAAPLGLDLGATSPEETALSMFAEIVAHRHGRQGGRLSAGAGRIHDLPV